MAHPFLTIGEKGSEIAAREICNAILGCCRCHFAEVIGYAVHGIHRVSNRKIIEWSRLSLFALEWINICHVEAEVWQQQINDLGLKDPDYGLRFKPSENGVPVKRLL